MARNYKRDRNGRFARNSGGRAGAVIGANAVAGAIAARNGRSTIAVLHGAKIATTGVGYVAHRRNASVKVQRRIRHADKAVNAGLALGYTAVVGTKVGSNVIRGAAAQQASKARLHQAKGWSNF